jgi:tetratricopeptide (TPR) repeat protein
MYLSAKPKDALQITEKGMNLLTTAKNLSEKIITEKKARFLIGKGACYGQLGDYEKMLDFYKEALSFAQRSGDKQTILFSLSGLGIGYVMAEKAERGEELINEALELAKELGSKFDIALCSIYLGFTNTTKREYEQAINLYTKAFAIAEEIGSTLLLGWLDELGAIYRDTFQLDKALECYQESIKHLPLSKHIAYANIGYIYFMKYELEKGNEYYLKAMKLCEKIKDRRILPSVLFNLVEISIELNNFSHAKKYLKRLEQIKNETGFDHVNKFYRYAKIMVLKSDGSISDLAKAAKLLNQYLEEKDLAVDTRLSFLYSLLEIRIKELQISATKEAFLEVQKQSHHLEVEAKYHQFRWFLAEVYRLQSQLSLIELDLAKAFEYLEKAQVIADELETELLKKKIQEDREIINQQLSKLQKFQEQKASISETVKLVSLEDTVKDIKQETILEERDEETGKVIEYRKLFALKI